MGSLGSSAFSNTGAGWASNGNDNPAPISFTTEPLVYAGSAQSCPDENLNLASRLSGLSARFDQATRAVDLNGDGRSDLIYKRALSGSHPEGFELWTTYELRAGTLIAGENGLVSGVFNNSHWGWTFGDITGTDVEFGKLYDHPEWQPPFNSAQGVFWSNFNTCKSSLNVWAGGHSGKERLTDLNGDGLPEILESALWFPCEGCSGYSLKAAFVNNGYGWQYTTGGTPEPFLVPPYWFYEATSGETITDFTQYPDTFCDETEPGDGEDFGVRLVDVNGDGGPDMIGGGSPPPEGIGRIEAALWDATVPDSGSGNSLWRPAPGWNIPAEFSASDGQDSGLRLADVNADGMIDIVASDGAYLNLGEPPDRLDTVTSPWGAVTSIEYDPHTIFDDFTVPPDTNPTVDGQRRADRPRWVVTAIETDPGFGQPTIRQEFEYDDGVYDIDDRAFRGFSKVTSLGPIADGVRRVTETFFHTSDALRARPAEFIVSSAPAGDPNDRTMLNRTEHEYAFASGADTDATVIYADGSTNTLDNVDSLTQTQAFDPFAALMSGATMPAEAHLALVIGTEVEVAEGTGTSVFYRREQTFDAYGNITEERDLGDETPDGGGQTDPSDDVSTTRQFAVLDGVSGSQHVLLANRVSQITVAGAQGSLPAETIISRTIRFYYDNSSTLGDVTRGNPTVVEQDWQGGAKLVQVVSQFDVYGNRTTTSTPYDPTDLSSLLFMVRGYDTASQTFVTSLAANPLAQPSLALTSTYEYELPSCGAPVGMGLVCRAVDGTGRESSITYDAFGRQIAYSGPNGAAFEIDYHDADRGTIDQRTERRTRWDPNGPQSPKNDPGAILTQLYYDGLRRTLTLTRPGISTNTANRTFTYDPAGRLAESTRWEDGTTLGPATIYDYDALGRAIRQTRSDNTIFEVAYEPRKVTATSDEPNDGIVHRRIDHFDGRGRLSEVEEFEDPATSSVSTTYLYDPFDQVVLINNPIANDPNLCGSNTICENQTHATEILYDELGNRTRLIDPDAGTITTTYDARGLIDTEQDGRGLIQDFTIDPLGRLVRRHAVNPQGTETDDVLEYGLAGVDGPNQVGRLIRIDDAEGYAEFDYDDAGNLSWHRRVVQGRQFDFDRGYDPLGRVLNTTYPDGEVVTWHYDKRLLTRISTSGGDYSDDYVADLQYDPLDRLTTAQLGGSVGAPVVTQTWGYDPTSGRLDAIGAVAGGSSVSLSYMIDGVGRVRDIDSSFTIAPAAPVVRDFTFEYDGLDRLIETTGNYDTVDPLLSKTLAYDHDDLGNLTQKDSDTDSMVDDGWVLTYQDPTRPHAVTSSVHETGFPTRAFDYDASGNVTSKWTQASAADPLVEATLTYDSVGRLIEYDPQNPGLVWTLGYDAFGRRIVSQRGGLLLFYPEPDYEYHHNLQRVNKHFFVAGRRVASSEVAWAAPEAGVEPIAWLPAEPPSPLALLAVAYACLLTLLLFAMRRPQPWPMGMARLRRLAPVILLATFPFFSMGNSCNSSPNPLGTHAETALFYITDHLTSTAATVRTDGTIRNVYQYLPFGGHVVDTGPVIHHTFTGEDLLGSGLIALGARYYDPELGRFLQPDPIVPNPANPQSLNPYTYVLNNPLNWIDPTGLSEHSPAPRGSSGESPGFDLDLSWLWGPFFGDWYMTTPERPPIPDSTAGNIPRTLADRLEQRIDSPAEEKVANWLLERTGGWSAVEDPVQEETRRAGIYAAAIIVGNILGNLLGEVISPSDPVEQTDPGPDAEGGPYSDFEDPPSVGPGKDFTAAQKRKILDANRERSGGRLRDDDTGRYLSEPQRSRRGVSPPDHEAQVDHIVPKNPADPNVSPGTNSYSNAKVISRKRNREKSNR